MANPSINCGIRSTFADNKWSMFFLLKLPASVIETYDWWKVSSDDNHYLVQITKLSKILAIYIYTRCPTMHLFWNYLSDQVNDVPWNSITFSIKFNILLHGTSQFGPLTHNCLCLVLTFSKWNTMLRVWKKYSPITQLWISIQFLVPCSRFAWNSPALNKGTQFVLFID